MNYLENNLHNSARINLYLLVPGLWVLVLHHPSPQPEPLLVQLLVVGGDVAEPDVARQQDLLVPALVEGDQVTNVSVAYVCFLCQHSSHKNIINTKNTFITGFKHLNIYY